MLKPNKSITPLPVLPALPVLPRPNGRRGLCLGCGRMAIVVWHTSTCEHLCADCAACPETEEEEKYVNK